ncbi:MAG: 3-deoxy-manno-octulosonate cytidylyltransferase [Muribaculaceae bacterium]|nr:3-deoxy-manno-octulosonate cytidylyltransferase [Muribaculaceae bacterium]
MEFVGIIPARYASTRFPGKPLADIGGMTMIERVYRQASKSLDNVWVATDDTRIFDTVTAFGGNAIMTSDKHRSGTDRCYEAYCNIASKADVIINIQGDEPFIDPAQIEALKSCFTDQCCRQIATLVREFDPKKGFDALFDPNTPKVVFDDNMNALYFSRSIIPYVRNAEWKEWLNKAKFHTHIGMYAYHADILKELVKLPQSSLEIAESLEQLRWLQAGYKIKIGITNVDTIGIDTPADLEAARRLLAES